MLKYEEDDFGDVFSLTFEVRSVKYLLHNNLIRLNKFKINHQYFHCSMYMQITKDCYGSVVTEELIPGGSKVPVTKENKYVAIV